MKAYKISMISGSTLMMLAFIVLGFSPFYLDTVEHKMLHNICVPVLIAGLVLCFVTEGVFNFFYTKQKENKVQNLKTSVLYSGAVICLITFLFLIFNTIFCSIFLGDYKFPVCIISVVIFISYMILQKRRLRKSGVKVGKTVSIVSLSIVMLAVISLIVIVCFFEFIVYSSLIKEFDIILQTRAYAQQYTLEIAKEHSLVYVFMIMSLPLFVSVLMNYIELAVKVRKLPVAK